ncbi:MAG: fasciclin domain-containing protein [Hyphomonas sp.]
MNKLIVSAAASLLITLPALAGEYGGKSTSAKSTEGQPTKAGYEKTTADIVETAAAAGSFSTLLAAAEAAGLVDALKGEGPLTVFAPTDDAFAALPAGTVETLLKPENKDQLAAILKLHVISGKVKSKDLAGKTLTADTLGGPVTVDGTDGVKVNDAAVTAADIKASNGIIHVIDKVLLPSS